MQTEEKIYELLKQGEIIKVEELLDSVKEWNEKLTILSRLVKIFHIEVQSGAEYTVFDYSVDMDMLVEHFSLVKLMLRRIEFDMPKDAVNELYEYCEKNKVSVYMLASIVFINIFHKEKVCEGLIDLYKEKKGQLSEEAEYFASLLKYIREKQCDEHKCK